MLAATALVDSGDAPRTRLVGSKPKAGSDYRFFCSFPGHSAIMKGKLVVTR
jgi:azurin